MVDNADAKSTLEGCASDKNHYYDASGREELLAEFSNIAQSLSRVRLTRWAQRPRPSARYEQRRSDAGTYTAARLLIVRSVEVRTVPPKEMDAVLEHLPLRIGAYVPDDLLEDWFAPGTGMKPPSAQALDAAKAYGWRFECEFKYYPERMEGVFWKWVPAI